MITNGLQPIKPLSVTQSLERVLSEDISDEIEIKTNTRESGEIKTKEEVKSMQIDVANLKLPEMEGIAYVGEVGKTELMSDNTVGQGAIASAAVGGTKLASMQSFGRLYSSLVGFVTKKDAGTVFTSTKIPLRGADGKPIKIKNAKGNEVTSTEIRFGLIEKKPSPVAGIIVKIPTQLIGVTAKSLLDESSIPEVDIADHSTTTVVDNQPTICNLIYGVTGGMIFEDEATAMSGKAASDKVLTPFLPFNKKLYEREKTGKLSYFKISFRSVNLKSGETKIAPRIRNACSRPLITPQNYIPLRKDEEIKLVDLVANKAANKDVIDGYALAVNKVLTDREKSAAVNSNNKALVQELFTEQNLNLTAFDSTDMAPRKNWYTPFGTNVVPLNEVAIPRRVLGKTNRDGVEVDIQKKAPTIDIFKNDSLIAQNNVAAVAGVTSFDLRSLATASRESKKAQEDAAKQQELFQTYVQSIDAVEIGAKMADLRMSIQQA